MRHDRDFLAVVGATGVGKTDLSLVLAERIGGEIVSMDSRQVYRGMDVGTAKTSAPERARVPHHGLDVVDPGERYSAGRFARDARGWMAGIRARGRVPLLVGGTGFFLRALTDPIFRQPELDRRRLEALREHLQSLPLDRLEAWVRALDPERAELATSGGRQRLSRTAEVALLTGRPLSWWHREAPPDGRPLEGLVVVLERSREALYRRIDERVGRMAREGLVDEVRGLLERGFGPDAPGMSGVGYREVVRYLRGEWSLDDALDAIRRASRRYARRQLTWFRNQLPDDGVLRLDAGLPPEALADRIVEAWNAEADSGEPSGHGAGGAG